MELNLNGKWKLGLCDDAVIPECKKLCSMRDAEDLKIPIIDALVPGNFEIDMEQEGMLPDLFFGMNLSKSQDLEMTHLFYSKDFRLSVEDCKKDLSVVFEGIDTVAEIYLNGMLIGKTDNMFLEHVLPLNCLYEGDNELFVHIIPVSLAARSYEGEAYLHSGKYGGDRYSIRKSAYMWGWDIFPRILTGGIWKNVYIREEKPSRILQAYLITERLSTAYDSVDLKWFYDVQLQRENYKDLEIELTGSCKDSQIHVRQRLWSKNGTIRFSLSKPCLWWPAGKGEQNLYDLKANLYHKGALLDTLSFQTGIRSVELLRTSVTDENGRGEFCFIINHRKTFILGTNWVPLDSLPSRGKEKLPAALDMVEDLGCNMIRCWGGGYYEYDEFYEICDRKGILVWQDFMLGGGWYPQADWFLKKIYDEAVAIIKRLRHHPCLVLWCGDNECDDVAKKVKYPGYDPNDNLINRSVLKDAVRRHDYARPYLPSSPYIDEMAFKKGHTFITENHLWGPRDYYKNEFYTKNLAHFVSETGYHGCPEPASIRRFISEGALWPYENNPEWLFHASNVEPIPEAPNSRRIPLMANQIKVLFGSIPDNLELFALQSQISQGEALKLFVERMRCGKWRRTGILWWNLLDGCPQFSDAIVDYFLVKKLAYGYIKQSQQPVCLMFAEPENDILTLIGVNDTNDDAQIQYQVQDVLTGQLLLQGAAVISADNAVAVSQLEYSKVDLKAGGFLKIEWQMDKKAFKNHYVVWRAPFNFEQYRRGAALCGLLAR